jgi:hypothetical protein
MSKASAAPPRGFVLCFAFGLLFSLHAFAQGANLREIPIAWYEEPEHHAPHWHIDFDHPTLDFSQRLVVGVRATVPADVRGRRPDWHIYLGIADGNGRWSVNYDHSHIDLRQVPLNAKPLLWHGYAFVRPGTYRIALVAYDAINERRFVWRRMVQVDRPSVLPDIDRDLPTVEFVDPDRIPPPVPEYIPIHTHAPMRVDVVFNLTGNEQLSLTPNDLDSFRHPNRENGMRAAAGVLSQLAPAQGCVRVSAIDILRLKIVLDRSPADASSNLNRVQQAIPGLRDNAAIDIHSLMGRTKAREFFHQFVDKIVSDNAACSPEFVGAGRAIIVVSDSLVFPENSDTTAVVASQSRSSLIFHIRFSSPSIRVSTADSAEFPGPIDVRYSLDEVGHMLSPLHPRNFAVVEPKDLRRAVAEIVQDIETSTTVSAVRR